MFLEPVLFYAVYKNILIGLAVVYNSWDLGGSECVPIPAAPNAVKMPEV